MVVWKLINGNEDLRELLASNVLSTIGFPHADIVLICDDKGTYSHNLEEHHNGCFSINVLKENEEFIALQLKESRSVSEFIENDLAQISTLPNITPEVIERRKIYLAQWLYSSAILSNTDLKYNNCQIIHNKKTGGYRNPEYYDSGLSFISSHRHFFDKKDSNEVLKELYKDYAVEIFPLAQETEKKLTPEKVNELLTNPVYESFGNETKKQIIEGLNNRVSLVKTYNHNILKYGNAEPKQITVKDIKNKSRGSKIELKDKVSNFISNLKNRIIGKDSR